MRVWDMPVAGLCNKHLVAQHHEIHCIFSIIAENKSGFSHHPEVMRWRGRLGALYRVHEHTAAEMLKRSMRHMSELETPLAFHLCPMPLPWQPVNKQKGKLAEKGCGCKHD